jgi:hypothetical protein
MAIPVSPPGRGVEQASAIIHEGAPIATEKKTTIFTLTNVQ